MKSKLPKSIRARLPIEHATQMASERTRFRVALERFIHKCKPDPEGTYKDAVHVDGRVWMVRISWIEAVTPPRESGAL